MANQEKKNKKALYILIHALAFICFIALVAMLISSRRKIGQLMAELEPSPTASPQATASPAPEDTYGPLPTLIIQTVAPATATPTSASAGATPSQPTATPSAAQTVKPTATLSAKPTASLTPAPTATATTAPTAEPTQKPTTKPTDTPAPTDTPTPTETPSSFTYSVSVEDWNIGYKLVFVSVDPPGDYIVSYSGGTSYGVSNGEYVFLVPVEESGDYASNVSVSRP